MVKAVGFQGLIRSNEKGLLNEIWNEKNKKMVREEQRNR